MPEKTSQIGLLGMAVPERVRRLRKEGPFGLPRASESQYFLPQLGVIRGMSVTNYSKSREEYPCFENS